MLLKPKKNKKTLIINNERLETRVALVKDDKLEEYMIERSDVPCAVGSVYLGRVVNVEPTLRAVFVNIGEDRNAFLPFKEMLPVTHDLADNIKKKPANTPSGKRAATPLARKLTEIEGRIRKMKGARITYKDIPSLFPKDSEVLVQIAKGPIGTKGPKVTMDISLAGRYLVLLPFADNIGLSRKITDGKERSRLRKIMEELEIPDGLGCICRTNAEERKKVFLKRDLDTLLELWKRVETANIKPGRPALLYKAPNLLERTARDSLTEDVDRIVIDDKPGYSFVKDFLVKVAGRRMASRVALHAKASPIFEAYKVEDQISAIFERKVLLDGGGYICVDETEALVAIDVNSGIRKGKDQSDTALDTNLAACEEIARQLRLRDVGGLVVIDFIDMRSQKDRDLVLKLMRRLVKEDRARSMVLPISKLGLMQMTRQRENESVLDRVFDPCPHCAGTGRIKSPVSVSVLIQRRLREVLTRHQREKDLAIRINVHPSVLARLKNEDGDHISELEGRYGHQLTFRADSSLHHEEFKMVDPDTGVELR